MGARIQEQGIFEVYTDSRKKRLYTKSLLLPAKSHFAEIIVRDKGEQYREWDPKRSKLAAYIKKGCSNTGIRKGSVVLYLGASHGFTVSFLSDMVGEEGLIYALDFAPRTTRDLVFLCEQRKNIIPLLESANHPQDYIDKVSQVDLVFQDIAQRDQVGIFLKNVRLFLKEGGVGLLSIKAKSIDMKRRAKAIFAEVREQVEKEFMVNDLRELAPFELEHAMLMIKKRAPTVNPTAKKGAAKKSSRKLSRVARKPIRRQRR